MKLKLKMKAKYFITYKEFQAKTNIIVVPSKKPAFKPQLCPAFQS